MYGQAVLIEMSDFVACTNIRYRSEAIALALFFYSTQFLLLLINRSAALAMYVVCSDLHLPSLAYLNAITTACSCI